MTGRRCALVLTVVFFAAFVVQPANSRLHLSCLVSNLRTGLGTTSLQAAIDAAATNDTLVVKGTCFGNSTIDKNLTLRGVLNKHFGVPTLDGSGFNGSVVAILGGVTAAIKGLMITHGANTAYLGGGGISNAGGGTVTLTNTSVSGNAAALEGGGILNRGSLTLINSIVSRNTARDDGGFVGEGGGISNHTQGSVTLVRSIVSGNSASTGGGIFTFAIPFGVTLMGSTVSGNTGGGISANFSVATLSDSRVSDNSGRGISGIESNLTVTTSTVSGNTGGGIFLNHGSLVLTGSTVSGNTTTTGGGGVWNLGGTVIVDGSTVSQNTGTYGGGIYNTPFVGNGLLTLADSTVSGNTATIDGGGIYNDPASTTILSGINTFLDNHPNDCVGVVGC